MMKIPLKFLGPFFTSAGLRLCFDAGRLSALLRPQLSRHFAQARYEQRSYCFESAENPASSSIV